MTQTIITTLGSTSWTVPANVYSIQVECVGGGGNGSTQASDWGAGGGGGAYSKTNTVSVSPGATVYLYVGAAATDTWVNKAANSAPASTANGCLAKGGSSASAGTGGAGGSDASCIGDTRYSGGAGANFGGGGGSAGPSGVGKNSTAGSSYGGSGGGGSNGGSSTAGSGSTDGNGAAGGNGTGGTGGGSGGTSGSVDGGNGTAGGGGGGGYSNIISSAGNGGAGGSDTAFDGSHGCGGGGGAAGYLLAARTGGAGGSYGGGGGAGVYGGSGGSGAQGLIVLTYTATVITPNFSNFSSGAQPRRQGGDFTDFRGFGRAETPREQRDFPIWPSGAQKLKTPESFDNNSFYEPPLPIPPTFGGSFGEWWPVPYKAPQGQEFPSQYLYPPPQPLEPLCFDPWPPAHKVVHSPVDFGLFAIRPVEVLIPDPSDAVRRPNKKISRKSRFEYSIYNHPPFDVIHEEYHDVTLTDDELDEARLQAIDSLLAELSVSHPENEPTEQVIPPDSFDVIAVEIDVDPEFGAQREVLHALAAQQRAIEDRLDVADLMTPQMVNGSEFVEISDVVGAIKPTVELNAAVDLSILRVQKDGVDVMSAIESFIFGDKS